MQCSKCGAEVSVLREFCPKCGTSIAAGMRERGFSTPGARPVEELQRNRGRVLMVGACILMVLGAMGRLSWPGLHFQSHHHQAKGPVVIGAAQLYQAYRDDPAGAERRFGGREIVVSGAFVRTVPDGYGSIDMRLKTTNPDAPLGVDLDRVSVDQATKLEPGQNVTVSCHRVARTGDERWLQDCAIQPAGEVSAPAVPSTASPSPSPR
jgi:hypothetical protein